MAPLPSPPPHVLSGSFTLNRDSVQARGLSYWWPLDGTARLLERERVRNSIQAVGTDVTLRYDEAGVSKQFFDAYYNTGYDIRIGTSSCTISYWTRYTITSLRVAVGKLGSSGNAWWVGTDNKKAAFAFNSEITGGPDINDDKWHLITATRIGSAAALYVDGASVATGTDSTDLSANEYFAIGRFGTNNGFNWTGALRDVRIKLVGSTAAEVWNLYSDPYDLYASPRRKTYFMPTAAAPTYPSRLLLLGVG
jgi:hypothetical protein